MARRAIINAFTQSTSRTFISFLGGIIMKKMMSLSMFAVLILASCRIGGNTNEPTSNTPSLDSSGNPIAEKVSLKYWNSLTGADGGMMRQLVAAFNAAYPGEIEVIETFTNEVDYYTNINLLVPLGRGPDVAIMHSYLVQSYANSDILVPIDDYITNSNVEIKAEDYIADVFSSMYFEDELYGVPLDVHTVGIYYNIDLLNKYSLAIPTNRAELLQAAKTVQAGEKASKPNFWGLPVSQVWPSEWTFTTALYQQGGEEIDANGNPAFNSPEGIAAMRAVADLIHVEQVSPLNLSVDQDLFLFQTGQALFHIQGSWMLNSMIEAGLNFGVLPLSKMFSAPGSETENQIAARSHTFVVPKQSRTVDVNKQRAIMTFIKYMGDNSSVWAQAGQIPASNIARATPEYAALPYHDGFGDVENFRVAAQSPYFHQAFSPVYSRITAAMANPNYDPVVLLTAAETEALQLLAEARA
jgi:multiple sugar transport system substrate-binding protein